MVGHAWFQCLDLHLVLDYPLELSSSGPDPQYMQKWISAGFKTLNSVAQSIDNHSEQPCDLRVSKLDLVIKTESNLSRKHDKQVRRPPKAITLQCVSLIQGHVRSSSHSPRGH